MARLDELGWSDSTVDDPATAWGMLFEEQGRAVVSSPALDSLLLPPLLAMLGEQAVGAAIVYPSENADGRPTSTLTRRALVVDGIALAGSERASLLVVPVATPGGTGLVAVDRSAPLEFHTVGGIDPDAGWSTVRGGIEVHADQVVTGPEAHAAWEAAVAAAQRGLAAELIGLAASMTDMAVEHVTNRTQFGRPVGSFQAVKHRLADAFVARTSAEAALPESWRDPHPILAMMARSLAGRAHEEAARHALQVCGAMGFTVEFPLHRAVRRGYLLDQLLGPWRRIRTQVGGRLLANGATPRLPALR